MMCSKFIKYEGWTVEGPPSTQRPSVPPPPQDKQQHLLLVELSRGIPGVSTLHVHADLCTCGGCPAHCLGTCLVEQLFPCWP